MRTSFCRLSLALALAGALSLAAAGGQPAADARPGAILVAPASITYHAQAGDTLTTIATRFTTRADNWAALGKVNNIARDTAIPIGTPILIPAELLADDPIEGKVAALSGTITARAADGRNVPLAIGAVISEGMEIDTSPNGFLTVALPDASRISIPSNSKILVSKLRQTRYTKSPRTELTLVRGRVESHVSPLEAIKGRFDVITPHSVAGVRGTHFRVGLVGKGTANEVLEGTVAVGSRKQPDSARVGAGKGAIVTPSATGSVVDLLPAPQVLLPANSDYAAPVFALQPVTGAAAYHVQVSNDREAVDLIAESRAAAPQVKVEGLRDGRYYMHVSAIDKAGLEGLVRSQEFTLHQRSEARLPTLSPPWVERSDARTVTMRWQPQAGKSYVLQVARDADFSWLIHTSRVTQPEATFPRPEFGTYYARMQAVGADGATTAYSAVQPFVVTDQWVLNDGSQAKMRNMQRDTSR